MPRITNSNNSSTAQQNLYSLRIGDGSKNPEKNSLEGNKTPVWEDRTAAHLLEAFNKKPEITPIEPIIIRANI